MTDANERARELFNRGCTCGGIDIGVGQMHEPGCGYPTPDEVAAALAAEREKGRNEFSVLVIEEFGKWVNRSLEPSTGEEGDAATPGYRLYVLKNFQLALERANARLRCPASGGANG